MSDVQYAPRANSAAHINLLRMLPCSVCQQTKGVRPYHLRYGRRVEATDRRALPLCPDHGGVNPRWFAKQFGMDAEALTEALWKQSGDLWRLHRVLLAHKLIASRELAGRRK